MKPNNATLLTPIQAASNRDATLSPNPQEQERQQSSQEDPSQPTAQQVEQKRSADYSAWNEFLTQPPVNISRANEPTPVMTEETLVSPWVREQINKLNEFLRGEGTIPSDEQLQRLAVEQPTEKSVILTDPFGNEVLSGDTRQVESTPNKQLKGVGLVGKIKEGVADLIKHINFRAFFKAEVEAIGDLWKIFRGEKEKQVPQPDPNKQAEAQARQLEAEAAAQEKQRTADSKLAEIFRTTTIHQVEDLTAAQRAQLGGYHETSANKDTPHGIAWTARAKKDREQQAQQPQDLPKTGHKEQPGLFKPTTAQMISPEHGEGSSRITGRNTTG